MKIEFYEKDNGKSEMWEFLETLRAKASSTFVLLHPFRKKSQKTPHREIEKAKAERDDYLFRKETDKA